MTLVEVIAATFILAVVAGGAMASWSLSSRAATNKRAVEMGVAIAVQEIERLKAIRYPYLAPSALSGGTPVPTVRWFDKYGNWLGTSAVTGDFKVNTVVRVIVDRDDEANSEDLKELIVEVWDADQTRLFERARTLLTFGGL